VLLLRDFYLILLLLIRCFLCHHLLLFSLPPSTSHDCSSTVNLPVQPFKEVEDVNDRAEQADITENDHHFDHHFEAVPLLTDLDAPVTDDSIPSTTIAPLSQQAVDPSLSTLGSTHPMVTRSRDVTRRPKVLYSLHAATSKRVGFIFIL
ncbi:two-component response regulator-like APRR5-like protein, partial [Corchorus olitorius]